jgi:hypothetical protein
MDFSIVASPPWINGGWVPEKFEVGIVLRKVS